MTDEPKKHPLFERITLMGCNVEVLTHSGDGVADGVLLRFKDETTAIHATGLLWDAPQFAATAVELRAALEDLETFLVTDKYAAHANVLAMVRSALRILLPCPSPSPRSDLKPLGCVCGLDHSKPIPEHFVNAPLVLMSGLTWCCHICRAECHGASEFIHADDCVFAHDTVENRKKSAEKLAARGSW